ncbi:hypothetical protein PIB30_025961 [Stylosanthes scabra]|uniref:Uncharacterized protein n=1 Tax=Stylosanthes scabra TaxID=79078 RepID=A0ABU6RAQ9_9FABA|nr:hypothetical protein [Stylosanthes scabra]
MAKDSVASSGLGTGKGLKDRPGHYLGPSPGQYQPGLCAVCTLTSCHGSQLRISALDQSPPTHHNAVPLHCLGVGVSCGSFSGWFPLLVTSLPLLLSLIIIDALFFKPQRKYHIVYNLDDICKN